MSVDIVMPRLSDSMEEGTILQWLKAPGDEVALGDELVEIETDKANMVYEAPAAGSLIEVLASEGDTLAIGEVIARVGEADPLGAGTRPVRRGGAEAGDRAHAVARGREPAAGAEDRALLGVRDDDAALHWPPLPAGSCSWVTGTAAAPIAPKSFS